MLGKSDQLPWWGLVLQAAREWHVAPWEVEENATSFWLDRWRTLRELEAEVAREKRKDTTGGK